MMGGNNGSGNIESRDEWKTPLWLYDLLNNQYEFGFDCCATKENAKEFFFSEDFLSVFKVNHNSWMNPPFSKARQMFTHFFNVIDKGVAIYRCDNMETKIWQDIILKNADWVFLIYGRVSYVGEKGKGARFPSALVGKGLPVPKYVKGKCVKVMTD